jgi:hypothetical protein
MSATTSNHVGSDARFTPSHFGVGARLGKLSIGSADAIETPALIVHTFAGSLPSITPDLCAELDGVCLCLCVQRNNDSNSNTFFRPRLQIFSSPPLIFLKLLNFPPHFMPFRKKQSLFSVFRQVCPRRCRY